LSSQFSVPIAAQQLFASAETSGSRQVKRVDPVYPEEAKKAGVSGVVILDATIGTEARRQGRCLRLIPARSGGARRCSQWEYEPTRNGEPVEVVMTVTVNFTLK
jgi:outer membrane biosynthesis protein TonB